MPEIPLLLGLLGDSRVYRSPSPKMHSLALTEANLRGYYVPLQLEAKYLKDTLPALARLNFKGLNVTAPLKESVLVFLNSLSKDVQKIGAANTLLLDPDTLSYQGFNTDASGFIHAYLTEINPSKALVIGAGGASRAILHALIERGFSPTIMNRSLEKALTLAKLFGCETIPWGEGGNFPLIVNTTSASSISDLGGDLNLSLPKHGTMLDINYNRPNNYFKDLANKSDAYFFDGLPMLASQARLSFLIWTSLRDISLDPFLTGAKT